MNGTTIAFRPRASRDYVQQLAYLEFHGNAAVANRFERSVAKTLTKIQEFPELGSPWESDVATIENIRYRTIERFRSHVA